MVTRGFHRCFAKTRRLIFLGFKANCPNRSQNYRSKTAPRWSNNIIQYPTCWLLMDTLGHFVCRVTGDLLGIDRVLVGLCWVTSMALSDSVPTVDLPGVTFEPWFLMVKICKNGGQSPMIIHDYDMAWQLKLHQKWESLYLVLLWRCDVMNDTACIWQAVEKKLASTYTNTTLYEFAQFGAFWRQHLAKIGFLEPSHLNESCRNWVYNAG